MHLERRVVITGLGALSPLGNSAQISWDACLKGTSGIQKIDFEIPDCPVSIGGKLSTNRYWAIGYFKINLLNTTGTLQAGIPGNLCRIT